MSIIKLDIQESDPALIVKRNHLIAKANEIEFGLEQESMKPLFEADLDEIKHIQNKWQEQLEANADNTESAVQLADIIININFVEVEDSKEFKMKLREVRCKLCFGLTRLPGVFCGGCRRIYCKTCIDKLALEKGEQFQCPNQSCTEKSNFFDLTESMNDFISNLIFVQCQNCGDEYDYDPANMDMSRLSISRKMENADDSGESNQPMRYADYVNHLLYKCQKIKIKCPFDCKFNGQQLLFQRYELKSHLLDQECPNFFVSCTQCQARVRVKDRTKHKCTLFKQYEQAKARLVQLKTCQKMCKGCHGEMLGYEAQIKGKEKKKRFAISDDLCPSCRESDMIKSFDEWKKALPLYYRQNHRKQTITSPWHHYQLQIIQKEMTGLDRARYEKEYLPKIQVLRQQHLGKITGVGLPRELEQRYLNGSDNNIFTDSYGDEVNDTIISMF